MRLWDLFASEAAGWSPANAALLARLSWAVYEPDARAEMERCCGAAETMPFARSEWGVQGMVADHGDWVSLTFRGSDEPVDWLRANARVAFAYPNWAAGDVVRGARGAVHRGFANALDAAWPSVLRRLLKLQDKPVWITGHSLGGALALLATLRLQATRPAAGCVTFGAPRIGDTTLTHLFHTPIWRVARGADAVPALPPLGYDAGPGVHVWLDDNGGPPLLGAEAMRAHSARVGSITINGRVDQIADHSAAGYADALEALDCRTSRPSGSGWPSKQAPKPEPVPPPLKPLEPLKPVEPAKDDDEKDAK